MNLERLNLLMLLLQNGLDPNFALQWIYLNRFGNFDSEAKLKIEYNLDNFAKYNYQYLDMHYVCYRHGLDRSLP